MSGKLNLKETIALFAQQILQLQQEMADKASKADLLKEVDRYPIGSPIPWPTNTLPDPDKYAWMIGQTFDPAAYPINAACYPTNVWPDMRKLMIKGAGGDRIILTLENDGNKTHSHTGTVSAADGVSTQTNDYSYGNLTTGNGGNHNHPISGITQFGNAGSNVTMANNGSWQSNAGAIAAAGDHAHVVWVGPHSHTVNFPSHGHTVMINPDGSQSEVTVKNIAFNYIVRLG